MSWQKGTPIEDETQEATPKIEAARSRANTGYTSEPTLPQREEGDNSRQPPSAIRGEQEKRSNIWEEIGS